MEDYRNTKYCKNLSGVEDRKKNVQKLVNKVYPRAIDMHHYIKDNKDVFKAEFIKAYNGKCAYCGVSIDIIPKEQFQIDHFVNEKAFVKKAKAGKIENLVLACYQCNHSKSDFQITDANKDDLCPDGDGIKANFTRDSLFNICLSETGRKKTNVCTFYEQVKLGDEIHRLDYLLMSMKGLTKKLSNEGKTIDGLYEAIDILQSKRNLM